MARRVFCAVARQKQLLRHLAHHQGHQTAAVLNPQRAVERSLTRLKHLPRPGVLSDAASRSACRLTRFSTQWIAVAQRTNRSQGSSIQKSTFVLSRAAHRLRSCVRRVGTPLADVHLRLPKGRSHGQGGGAGVAESAAADAQKISSGTP